MARKERYKAEQIAEALRETKGMTTLTARRLGCDYMTVRRYLDKYPTLAVLQKELTEQMGDAVELALYDEAVNKRNTAALIFLAKTKFKNRGYIERQEVTGAEGGPIAINIVGIPARDAPPVAEVESEFDDLYT